MNTVLDPQLLEFMAPYKLAKNTTEKATHVSLFPAVQYRIPDDAYEAFLQAICATVNQGGQHCICESPRDRMAVICSVTLTYDEVPEISYSDQLLWNLIRVYQSILLEQLADIHPENPLQLICFVLERQNDDGVDYLEVNHNLVYRFQVYFPYCRVESSYIRDVLQPRLIQALRSQNFAKFFTRTPMVTEWDHIIDFHIDQHPILMYGGIETRVDYPLVLTRCYGPIQLEDIEDQAVINRLDNLDEYGYPEDIYLEHFGAIKNRFVSPDFFHSDPDVWHWLPVFFSLSFFGEVSIVKTAITKQRIAVNRNFATSSTGHNDEVDRLDKITRLLPLLSQDRFIKYNDWLAVGKALCHGLAGNEHGLNMWLQSSRSHGIEQERLDTIENLWDSFCEYGTDGITEMTIQYLAYTDNKELYREWRAEYQTQLLDQAANCTDDDIAKAFRFCYPFEFLYAGKASGWWRFENHRWSPDPEGMRILDQLSDPFTEKLIAYRTDLNVQIQQARNQDRQPMEQRLKQLNQLMTKMKGEPFKERIMRTLRRHYRNESFDDMVDQNKYLTVCANGVIEICPDNPAEPIFFRPGRPEDFCTKSTRVKMPDLRPEVGPPRIGHDEMNKWFDQIFIQHYDEHGREIPEHQLDRSYELWMARWRSSLLEGGNERDKLFPQFFGESHTSKSQYEKLIFHMLGDYAIKGPSSLISFNVRKDPNAATPALARAAGCRLMFFDELDSKTVLDAGAIRDHSGGDSKYNRDLYQGSKQIRDTKQQYKIACSYNKEPPINDASVDAFWERIAVCPFKAKFVFTPPRGLEEQRRQRIFLREPRFEQKIKMMAPAMLRQAFFDYADYARYGLPACNTIIAATTNYRAHSDYYLNFITVALRHSPGSRVTIRRMYNHFKNWYVQKFPNSKPPGEPSFQQEMAAKRIANIVNEYLDWELIAEMPEPTRYTPPGGSDNKENQPNLASQVGGWANAWANGPAWTAQPAPGLTRSTPLRRPSPPPGPIGLNPDGSIRNSARYSSRSVNNAARLTNINSARQSARPDSARVDSAKRGLSGQHGAGGSGRTSYAALGYNPNQYDNGAGVFGDNSVGVNSYGSKARNSNQNRANSGIYDQASLNYGRDPSGPRMTPTSAPQTFSQARSGW